MDSYADAPDLNAKAKVPRQRSIAENETLKRSENSKRNQRLEAYDTKRFSINIGKIHQANSGAIVRLICEHCNVKSNQIGSINVGREASVFEVSKEVGAAVRKGMESVTLEGRRVSIRAAREASRAEVKELRMGVVLNGVESRVENVLIEGSMRVMMGYG